MKLSHLFMQYIENQRQYSIVNLELREAEEEVADLTSSYKSLQNEFVNVRVSFWAGSWMGG